jgi:putative transcriptional regulator
MPALNDPNFARSVTYICSHDDGGAMGIIINRPMALTLGEVMGQMQLEVTYAEIAAHPVLEGGPVLQDRGFVLHDRTSGPIQTWEALLEIKNTDMGVATSRDVLQALARGEGPSRVIVALGYAGWGPGQLEREYQSNAWLSGPAESEVIFSMPFEERYAAAARIVGVDLDRLSSDHGHA